MNRIEAELEEQRAWAGEERNEEQTPSEAGLTEITPNIARPSSKSLTRSESLGGGG